MQIDLSDKQSKNADSQRIDTLAPDSKMNLRRRSQSQKQNLSILSTDEGRQTDLSDEQPSNARSPNVEIFDPGSNLTDKT
jgi:hypothetical protein